MAPQATAKFGQATEASQHVSQSHAHAMDDGSGTVSPHHVNSGHRASAPSVAIDEVQLLQSIEVQMDEMRDEINRLQKTADLAD